MFISALRDASTAVGEGVAKEVPALARTFSVVLECVYRGRVSVVLRQLLPRHSGGVMTRAPTGIDGAEMKADGHRRSTGHYGRTGTVTVNVEPASRRLSTLIVP